MEDNARLSDLARQLVDLQIEQVDEGWTIERRVEILTLEASWANQIVRDGIDLLGPYAELAHVLDWSTIPEARQARILHNARTALSEAKRVQA